MYGVVREYQAPTGVTHAVRGRFGHTTNVWGVVFARKTSIELYNVRANQSTARLELVQSTKIGAPILSMTTLRRAGSPTDALWIGFDKMRLVCLTWDSTSRSWILEKALNLGSHLGYRHCAVPDIMTSTEFGNPGQKLLRGRAGNVASPLIRSDPSGRCIAALATTQDVLYVIPASDEIFIIDLRAEYNAANVKDFVFIQGTFEPIITVLYETKRTWAGRAAVVRNTSCLLSVKIDVRLKKHSKEWFMEKLPYDSLKLESVPYTADQGVLLLAPNVIMQIRHGVCVAGLSLNCFGDAYAEEMKGTYNTIRTSDMLMALDAGHCRFLDWEDSRTASGKTQNTCLLSLKGGELYFLTLATGSNNTLELQRAGSTVLASEIVPVNDRFFVLASRISDSLLVEYQRTVNGDVGKSSMSNGDTAKQADETAEDDADVEIYGLKPSTQTEKKSAEEEEEERNNATLTLTEKDEGTRGVYDDEDELGWVFDLSAEDEKASKANIHKGNWQLKVKDTLPCFGPGMDLTVGLSPRPTEETLDMVIAGGFAKNGCLAVVHQTVRPEDSTRFEAKAKGCKGAWTLRDVSVIRRFAEERKQRNKQTERRNESRRAKNTLKQTARKRFVDDLIAKKTQEEKLKMKEAAKISNGASEESVKPNGEEVVAEEDKIVPTGKSNGDIAEKKRKLEEVNGNESSTPKRLKKENGDIVPVDTTPTKKEKVVEDTSNLDEIKLAEEVIEQITLEADAEAEGLEKFQVEAEDQLEPDIEDEELLHAYLLLSTETSTLVLSTGGTELEHVLDKNVEYVTEEVTVTAANVMDERVSVQVTKSRIRVIMEGAKQCEYVRPDDSSPIVEAQVLDPHVLFTTADGRCSIFEVRAESFEIQKTKPSEGGEQNDMDVMFDEYGNELPSKSDEAATEKSKKASEGTEAIPGEKETDGEKEISFRNFSLHQEYESQASSKSSEHINSACLFKGTLASDLVLSLSKKGRIEPEQVPQSEKTAEKSDVNKEGTAKQQEAKNEAPESKDVDDDDDEEERMLYGEDPEVDEEEELMLYGDGGGDGEETKNSPVALPLGQDSMKQEGKEIPSGTAGDLKKQITAVPVEVEKGVLPLTESVPDGQELLLVLVTKSGTLEVRAPSLNFEVVLRCDHFFAGPHIVTDSDDKTLGKKLRAPKKYRIGKIFLANVQALAELPGLATPILVAITDIGLPLIYMGYLTGQGAESSKRSSLQFRKIYTADRTAATFAKSVSRTEAMKKHGKSTNFSVCRFSNVAGRSGLFVSGPVPFFIFAERGYPRVHALYHKDDSDPPSSILTLDELNVVNCRHGFVTVADNNIVRFGALAVPSEMNFDTPSPMRKINLRCTPHKVAYHAGSATYGVLASMPTPTTRQERMDRILQSLEKHDKRHYQSLVTQAEAENEDGAKTRIPPLLEELHELRIYRADTWEMIKSYKLRKGEVGLSIQNITVNVFKQRMAGQGVEIPSSNKGDDGNESLFAASLKMRPKNMLVVGTGFLNGEDATSKGRLLLFEVSRQDAHMGGEVHTAFQLQLISEKELASPVTAVAAMEGYVICGVGPLISVYKLVGDEIVHLSFQFGQLFCSSIATMKQYLVVGDIRKSVTFMYFRDRNSSVNFLGKDFEHVSTYATEFLVREDEMSIVVTDGRGNIHSLQYAHASIPESRGGKRLLVNGGVKLGSEINRLVRIRDCRNNGGFREMGQGGAGRQGLAFATLDGGIGMIVAVDEKQYEIMNKMAEAVGESEEVARYCGIETRTINEFEPESRATEMLGRRFLDSREACELFGMNALQLKRIAGKVGVGVADIAKTVTDIDGILETLS